MITGFIAYKSTRTGFPSGLIIAGILSNILVFPGIFIVPVTVSIFVVTVCLVAVTVKTVQTVITVRTGKPKYILNPNACRRYAACKNVVILLIIR
jgi:hypothetical protein